MPRTKQTARKSTGGKAPRKQLGVQPKLEPQPPSKPTRPSTHWRECRDGPHDDLKPDEFLDPLDTLLGQFEARIVSATEETTDERCFEEIRYAVKKLVLALNKLNELEIWIETGEREDLLEFIDNYIKYAGVDINRLNAEFECDCLADHWRNW
ncbi:hypothetical protein Q8F55_003046 [Vanrija albida]|uniref:Uncharacterized protein n=1 Tax=Vanrija albida TaxID=181172 RepID=A0ABR3QBE3_9TREE